jgi:hypothetical protein
MLGYRLWIDMALVKTYSAYRRSAMISASDSYLRYAFRPGTECFSRLGDRKKSVNRQSNTAAASTVVLTRSAQRLQCKSYINSCFDDLRSGSSEVEHNKQKRTRPDALHRI